MLVEHTLFGTTDKVQKSIDRLRAFEPPEGYYVAFSGGKDSQVIYHLCVQAGVKFDAHFHLTTVDPPELIYFIKEKYPDVIIHYPGISMWNLILKKGMPPTRLIRYCCSAFKENGGMGRMVVTGVRWAESTKRKNNRAMLELNAYSNNEKIMLNNDNDEARRMLETCRLKGKQILNPIIEWSEDDVWEYLNGNHIPHCCLYDEGFTRIGCIGCPMANTKGMLFEFARYPKYEAAYLRTFDRLIKAKIKKDGVPFRTWHTPEDLMHWWIYGSDKKVNEDQLLLDGAEW